MAGEERVCIVALNWYTMPDHVPAGKLRVYFLADWYEIVKPATKRWHYQRMHEYKIAQISGWSGSSYMIVHVWRDLKTELGKGEGGAEESGKDTIELCPHLYKLPYLARIAAEKHKETRKWLREKELPVDQTEK